MLFSVISFNIRFGLADDGTNNWPYRKHAVAGLFHKYPADFICVQELNDFQTEFMYKLLPKYNSIGVHKGAPDFWQNNVIFYRNTIECIDKQHFFLSETPSQPSISWGSRWPRQCTIGRYKAGSGELICINTHFDFEEPAQHKSAQLIWQKISTQFQDTPVILSGDFNAEPDSKTYRWLTGEFDETADTLPDFKETFKKPYPGTFHRFTGKPITGLIDWILYRGDLRFKKCLVIKDSFDGMFPSDHFPLMAYFET
jgi:endonuclease/exonuclease/phosphatase family metal-dependent hydrolase